MNALANTEAQMHQQCDDAQFEPWHPVRQVRRTPTAVTAAWCRSTPHPRLGAYGHSVDHPHRSRIVSPTAPRGHRDVEGRVMERTGDAGRNCSSCAIDARGPSWWMEIMRQHDHGARREQQQEEPTKAHEVGYPHDGRFIVQHRPDPWTDHQYAGARTRRLAVNHPYHRSHPTRPGRIPVPPADPQRACVPGDPSCP